ncbi:MAG: hypothetical protein Mars2KO_44450 [Maribacter sp.]
MDNIEQQSNKLKKTVKSDNKPSKKSPNRWILTSLIGGVFSFLLSFFFFDFEEKSFKMSVGIGVLVIIILLLANPVRRYIKVFYSIITVFTFSNKFFLEYINRNDDGGLAFGIDKLGSWENVFLLSIAGLALILDFKERNKLVNTGSKKQSTRKKIINISFGSNNKIKSEIDK